MNEVIDRDILTDYINKKTDPTPSDIRIESPAEKQANYITKIYYDRYNHLLDSLKDHKEHEKIYNTHPDYEIFRSSKEMKQKLNEELTRLDSSHFSSNAPLKECIRQEIASIDETIEGSYESYSNYMNNESKIKELTNELVSLCECMIREGLLTSDEIRGYYGVSYQVSEASF